MKLEKYKKKDNKKIIGIIIILILCVTIGYIIKGTMSKYQQERSFRIVDGKVKYTGGKGDITFTFYKDGIEVDTIPEKDTGYISYHLNVLVPVYLENRIDYVEAEIQIRTIAMDFWASLDHKIRYKFPNEIPADVKEKMYENSLIIKQLDNQMMHLNDIVNRYDKN